MLLADRGYDADWIEHFQAKRPSLRVRKMRQNKKLELGSDGIETELQALIGL
jgi:hypothetical protein